MRRRGRIIKRRRIITLEEKVLSKYGPSPFKPTFNLFALVTIGMVVTKMYERKTNNTLGVYSRAKQYNLLSHADV